MEQWLHKAATRESRGKLEDSADMYLKALHGITSVLSEVSSGIWWRKSAMRDSVREVEAQTRAIAAWWQVETERRNAAHERSAGPTVASELI